MKRSDKIYCSILKIVSEYQNRDLNDSDLDRGTRKGRLRHLLSYCKIKDKERHRLIEMINSSDEENYTVAELIILNKLQDE